MVNHSVRRRIAAAVTGLFAATLTAAVAGAQPSAPDLLTPPAPVPALDVERYLGTWYQLAAVPQYFNLVCARDTQATYALDPRGDISVRNRCTTWSGAPNEISGTARVNDPVTNAQLHVSFPGVPTQESLDGPTNYIVTALGPDYSWALVTDPTRLSGFVLSRTPALGAEQWAGVGAAIDAVGQSRCVYLTSPTTGGLSDIAPLCTR
ncbi:lipocalin family protein [Nocardia arizonensis]|uniref:lipocalin family protein n=1 Tax=Nocardia arizonensis TaxID=1141647 RepID=UPI0006D139C3|nr:lipocalin family protein [Nocardia arizonensis]